MSCILEYYPRINVFYIYENKTLDDYVSINIKSVLEKIKNNCSGNNDIYKLFCGEFSSIEEADKFITKEFEIVKNKKIFAVDIKDKDDIFGVPS